MKRIKVRTDPHHFVRSEPTVKLTNERKILKGSFCQLNFLKLFNWFFNEKLRQKRRNDNICFNLLLKFFFLHQEDPDPPHWIPGSATQNATIHRIRHLELPELGCDVLPVALHRDVVRQRFPLAQNEILAAGLYRKILCCRYKKILCCTVIRSELGGVHRISGWPVNVIRPNMLLGLQYGTGTNRSQKFSYLENANAQ